MGGDGVRAWRFLRRNRQYRASWLRLRPPPGLAERAPFAVRLQTAADLSAARFGLLAWLDPFARDGPASPFWAEAPMAAAMASPGGMPLTGMAAAGVASVTGLRTGDGALVLKIERHGTAVQVRLRDGGAFPDEGGLSLLREVVRIEDLWEGPDAPSPRAGRGMGMTNFRLRLTGILRAAANAGPRRSCSGAMRWRRTGARTAGCARGCGGALRAPASLPRRATATSPPDDPRRHEWPRGGSDRAGSLARSAAPRQQRGLPPRAVPHPIPPARHGGCGPHRFRRPAFPFRRFPSLFLSASAGLAGRIADAGLPGPSHRVRGSDLPIPARASPNFIFNTLTLRGGVWRRMRMVVSGKTRTTIPPAPVSWLDARPCVRRVPARPNQEGEKGMSEQDHYLSAHEAAAFLGLSTRTLDRYRVSGSGPAYHRFGGRVRYLRADLDAWAAARRMTSTSDDRVGDDRAGGRRTA